MSLVERERDSFLQQKQGYTGTKIYALRRAACLSGQCEFHLARALGFAAASSSGFPSLWSLMWP